MAMPICRTIQSLKKSESTTVVTTAPRKALGTRTCVLGKKPKRKAKRRVPRLRETSELTIPKRSKRA